MTRFFLTAALVSLIGLAAPAQAVIPGDAPATETTVGGFTPVAIDSPLVQDARNFVQSRIPSMTQVQVNVAYVQVVKGWNVKLIGTGVEDGQQVTWKFVVYKKLDGLMKLAMVEML